MNNLSSRDRQLLIIMPALLLFILYIFFVSMPMGEEKTELKEQLSKLKTSPVTQRSLSGRRKQSLVASISSTSAEPSNSVRHMVPRGSTT